MYQVYFSSSNVLTDTRVIIKEQISNEKSTICFKITSKVTKLHAPRKKSVTY